MWLDLAQKGHKDICEDICVPCDAQREPTVEKVDTVTCSVDISQPFSQPPQCPLNGPMNKGAMVAGTEAMQGLSSMDSPSQ